MSTTAFDPAQHLMKIKGKDYLEVKWRLVWLRHDHPDAQIKTNLHQLDADHAVCNAYVAIPNGGTGSGWAMCRQSEFPDYLEKAETSALGRALASLGYGTQFTDFDEGTKLADSPVARPNVLQQHRGEYVDTTHTPPRPGELASDAQKRKIWAMTSAKEKNWSDTQLHFRLLVEYGCRSLNDLTKRQASDLIEHLMQPEAPAPPEELAAEFLEDCNGIMAAQDMAELAEVWKVVYRGWEKDAVLIAVATNIKDARKAELSA